MIVKKGNGLQHVNARDIQPFIDDGGYEFFDNDQNPIPDDELQSVIDAEIEAHRGHANSYEELIEQLKAQGITLKED